MLEVVRVLRVPVSVVASGASGMFGHSCPFASSGSTFPTHCAGSRAGKQPDGGAETRKAKLAVVRGRPVRDPGSAPYNAAIETVAYRDTDAEPAPFARRILREAQRRGLDIPARQVLLGDGPRWIWNFANEHFPDAIQIVDIFHAKGHLFEVAEVILRTRQRDRRTMGQKAARGA